MPSKRQLDFHTADDVIVEMERLRRDGYTKTKNWNLTQICEHLTYTMVGEMEGLGFRLPWILRATVGRIFTNRILRTRRMPSVPTLRGLKPKSTPNQEDDSIIAECIEAVVRSQAFTGSLETYPFVDHLTHEQWRAFMWIHAAHHLGFLIPNETNHPMMTAMVRQKTFKASQHETRIPDSRL